MIKSLYKSLHSFHINCFSSLKLPIIDISPYISSSSPPSSSSISKATISSEIASASEQYGAFLLKNHPLLSPRMISSMKSFFTLSTASKALVQNKSIGFTRGYIGMGEESGSDSYEVKEAFSYGFDWSAAQNIKNPLQGPNIWPDENQLPGFKFSMLQGYKHICQISEALTKGYSMSLGLKEDYLGEFCKEGDTISLMRLFHYFPYHQAPKETEKMKKIGSSEHTDWGFLTIILQENNVPGLQIYHESEWFDVEPVDGTLVVNCGDYLSLLTNGRYKSPLHRVVSKGKDRVSAVFFYYPSYEAKIPKLFKEDLSLFKNQRIGGQKTLGYEDIEGKSFGEYIMEKWKQVARDGKMY